MIERCDEAAQLFERSAAQGARSGRILQDQIHVRCDIFERALEQPAGRHETLRAIAVAVRSQMRVDVLDAARRGDRQIVLEQLERSAGYLGIFARQIDEIRRVDDAGIDAGLLAGGFERLQRGSIDRRRAVTARVAGKYLQSSAADVLGMLHRRCISGCDANVDADPHRLLLRRGGRHLAGEQIELEGLALFEFHRRKIV